MNYGFIDYKPQGQDYIFEPTYGGEIDWLKYLPENEFQSATYFDSMACVSFSATNILEMLIIRGEETGELNVDWLKNNAYYKNGKPNFSDRFVAKLSGTTRAGNTFAKVAQTINVNGLVAEDDWHFPREQRQPIFDWNDYYKEIPQEVLDKGKEFLKRYEVNYYFVRNSSLKYATVPTQVAIYAWGRQENGVYQRTDLPVNHAVVYVNGKINIYDTYVPFLKTMVKDYLFNEWGLIYTIKNKSMEFYKEADSNTVYILGKGDGLYHPIYSGKVALDIFTKDWNSMNIKIVNIPKDKIGYRIAGII